MLIGSWQKLQNHSVSVFINDKALTCVTSTQYLGVITDQNLTWKLHVNYVLKRIRCKLHALYHLKSLPSHLLLQLRISDFCPNYCDAVWSPTTVSLSKPLECLHSRFLQGVSVCNTFVKLTLVERRRFHTAVQLFMTFVHSI